MTLKSTAVVHEWWAKHGGSEKVTRAISLLFPASDLWSLYLDKDVDNEVRNSFSIKESWLKKVPGHEERIIAAALSPIVFRTLTAKKYDVVISSSHNFAHTVKFPNRKETIYLSYVHTPSRSVWTPDIDRRTRFNVDPLRNTLKFMDKKMGSHVAAYAANSTEVANRIQKYWDRESIVIFPPVQPLAKDESATEQTCLPFPKGEYLVSAGRFVSYKNHQFSIKFAAELNMPLVIMGAGPKEQELRDLAESLRISVSFNISPNNNDWFAILENAYAFIFPVHEDFGITPIEAMSVGTPVIALGKGGAIDYIRDGLNGFLVPELNLSDFAHALGRVGSLNKNEIALSTEKFSPANFNENFLKWYESCVS